MKRRENARTNGRVRRGRREVHERWVDEAMKKTGDKFESEKQNPSERDVALLKSTQDEHQDIDVNICEAVGSDDPGGIPSGGHGQQSRAHSTRSEELDDSLSSSAKSTGNETLRDKIFAVDEGIVVRDDSEFSASNREIEDQDAEPGHLPNIGLLHDERDANVSEIISTKTVGCRTPLVQLLNWRSIFALLLSCGTVRMTVEQYETLRETLLWQSSCLGGSLGALPGIRKIQRSLVPLMRKFSYARSEVQVFRKRHSSTGQARVVLPSEWAILDTSTGPLYEAMFGRHSSALKGSGPRFVFEDIENAPIVRNRPKIIDPSHYIFVDAASSETLMECPRLPVVAEVGDCISVRFAPSQGADQILQSLNYDLPEENKHTVTFTIRFMWNVGGECYSSSTYTSSSNQPLFLTCSSLKAGDTVVELQLETSIYSCVLVYRCRRSVPGDSTRQLIFIPQGSVANGELNPANCAVCPVHFVQYVSSPTRDEIPNQHAPCTGYLKDGSRYVVYRVLLYCDDFQPHSSNTGSYGGCYMLPMGIPPAERSGYGAVRCIGLTPPQVSTNEVLHYVIPDLVKCSTTGVQGLDPSGNPVTIFIDALGYIGDYPAVTHALDLLGHNSRAPCHLCCFVRQDRIGQTGLPYYGYTTSVHSRATSFCRSMERMHSLRADVTNNQELTAHGFQPAFDIADYPLHALSNAISAARGQVPLTELNVPVVPAMFNPYMSSMVAPDHLLFGLAQDVLRATLSLCTPQVRKHVDILIRSSLSSSNLGKHRQVVNSSSASINSMGMSDMFAVLLVAPICFESAFALVCSTGEEVEESCREAICDAGSTENTGKKRSISTRKRAIPPSCSKRNRRSSPARSSNRNTVRSEDMLQLLIMFQGIVRETHFWPIATLDGAQTVHEFNRRDGQARLDMLYGSAGDYIRRLHDLCVRDQDVVGKYLNKPNVHRLLELYTHTIPAFGHSRHVQELLFETAHQPLKRAISRSNQRDPHLAAVTATLANDWESRLSIEVSSLGDPDSWTAEHCLRLQRLVAGREAGGKPDLDRIRSTFCKPVLSQLRKIRTKLSSMSTERAAWRVMFEKANSPGDVVPWRQLCTENRNAFMDAVTSIQSSALQKSFDPGSLRIAEYASSWNTNLERVEGLNSVTESRRRYGNIYPASVVQALVAEVGDPDCGGYEVAELSTPESDADFHSLIFRVSFWLVLGLFEANYTPSDAFQASIHARSRSYAVVVPCSGSSLRPVTEPVRVDTASRVSILPLTTSVRESMCIHACGHAGNCTIIGEGPVQHSGFIGAGTPFYVLGRREGYPPRVG
jgi:hypothetical protein